jgi:hypothetical protein
VTTFMKTPPFALKVISTRQLCALAQVISEEVARSRDIIYEGDDVRVTTKKAKKGTEGEQVVSPQVL